MYDGRTGRRWNIDPVEQIGESPYATFRGNPILHNDPNGDNPGLPWAVWALAEWTLADWLVAGAMVGSGAIIVDNLNDGKFIPAPIPFPSDVLRPTTVTPPLTIPVAVPKVITDTDVLKKTEKGFYQVTYKSTNKEGKEYIGRTSGYGTPQEIVDKRFKKHHKNKQGFMAGTPTMAVPSTELSIGNPKDPTYKFIRAAEDIQINESKKKGNNDNARKGISPSNNNIEEYYNTYNDAMQEKDNCVNCFSKKGATTPPPINPGK